MKIKYKKPKPPSFREWLLTGKGLPIHFQDWSMDYGALGGTTLLYVTNSRLKNYLEIGSISSSDVSLYYSRYVEEVVNAIHKYEGETGEKVHLFVRDDDDEPSESTWLGRLFLEGPETVMVAIMIFLALLAYFLSLAA